LQIAGASDDVERTLLVFYARQVDDDGVTLTNDLWFSDTDRVDTRADDLHCHFKGCGVVRALRLQRDRSATLEVETERRRVAGAKRRTDGRCRHDDDADQRGEQSAIHEADETYASTGRAALRLLLVLVCARLFVGLLRLLLWLRCHDRAAVHVDPASY